MNRQTPSVPLVRTVTLSMALALSACSEPSKPPPPPSTAPAFKDAPSEPPAAPAAPQASPTSPTPSPAPSETPAAAAAPQASPPRPTPHAADTPEQLFFRMGCKACHGPGSAYGSILVRARGKPAEEIAKWILHPEQIRPGTLMPSYAKRLSQEQALALAKWIQAGNPAPAQ